eukprot:365663-Chlamydomonas_euryale.AAC.16
MPPPWSVCSRPHTKASVPRRHRVGALSRTHKTLCAPPPQTKCSQTPTQNALWMPCRGCRTASAAERASQDVVSDEGDGDGRERRGGSGMPPLCAAGRAACAACRKCWRASLHQAGPGVLPLPGAAGARPATTVTPKECGLAPSPHARHSSCT